MINFNTNTISLRKISLPDWGAKIAGPLVFLLLFLAGSGLFALLAQNAEAQNKEKVRKEKVLSENIAYLTGPKISNNQTFFKDNLISEAKISKNESLGLNAELTKLNFPYQKVENLIWLNPGEELKLNKKDTAKKEIKEIKTSFPSLITAYNSEVAQCDSSPCITASGYNLCKYGVEDTVAANHLRFGTKVKIPEIFGDKVFVVRDRMNSKYYNRLDVWMLSKEKAVQFGSKRAQVQVLH